MDELSKKLNEKRSQLQKRRMKSNLTKLQEKTLHLLKNNEKFIVISCDKNLGPAVIERDEYVRRALKDHLADKSTYKRIHEGAAKMILLQMKDKVRRFTFKHSDELEEGERTYLLKSTKLEHRVPQFYITAKVHKTPWKTRPIVSTSGSLLANLSKWVDYNLNKIAKKSPTYILNWLIPHY